jgi:hypothetical protein
VLVVRGDGRAAGVGSAADGEPGRAGRKLPAGRPGRAALGLALAAGALAMGCQPTLEQQVGIVYSVDSPALGRVDSFELLTRDGRILRFDTAQLRFRPEFPASHLSEHQIIGDPIEVTYRRDADRLVVTQLDDADH